MTSQKKGVDKVRERPRVRAVDVHERRILITGASRGIGREISLLFAESGATLLLGYRANDEAAEEVARRCRERGAAVTLLRFDVGDPRQVREALARAQQSSDDPSALAECVIDVVVNNAGMTCDRLLARMEDEEWEQVIRTNLYGVYAVTKAVLPGMIRRRAGRIINIASLSGERGNAGQTSYCAAKAGVVGFSKALALEVAGRGITVNVVSPGVIDTEMTARLPRAEVERAIPLRRYGKAAEVASAVHYLASPSAGYITGQVIAVNGGLRT